MEKYTNIAAFIVPTGIGASIGGFAGDASCYARSLSKICPLIVNPNVVNAAVFSGINENMLYTEGYAIDSFFKGEIALKPAQNNKIGIIFDKAIPKNIINVHINTINAVKTVYGIDIIGYETTSSNVGIDFSLLESGISSGTIKNPETLLAAGKSLVQKGAQALGVVCYFDQCDQMDDNNYANGSGVDPVGGVEAIISHILTRQFNIPVAHAPAFDDLVIPSKIVDPRAAAEYITPTFLPCILQGLHNAPKLVKTEKAYKNCITLKNLKALITPYDCLGGIPVLSAAQNNIPIIAVKENRSVLNIDAKSLGIADKVIEVDTYINAKNVLLSLCKS